MRFKKTLSNLVPLAGTLWLACVVQTAAGSDLDTVRAKVRAKYPIVHQLPTGELAAWLADTNRPSPIMLDVRTEAEYAVSHLPGARRVDSRASASQVAKELERGRLIVTYCSVGYRSSQMAERLQKTGADQRIQPRRLDFSMGERGQAVGTGRQARQTGSPV